VRRLRADILGISSNDYLAIWRTNLCCPSWSLPAARKRWAELAFSEGVPWNTIVLLGSKVAKATDYPVQAIGSFSTCRVTREPDRTTWDMLRDRRPFDGLRVIYLPHPSGRNLVWNFPNNKTLAREILAECVPEIRWGSELD